MIFPGPDAVNIKDAVKSIETPNLDVIEEEIDEENFSISQNEHSFEDSLDSLEVPLVDEVT